MTPRMLCERHWRSDRRNVLDTDNYIEITVTLLMGLLSSAVLAAVVKNSQAQASNHKNLKLNLVS